MYFLLFTPGTPGQSTEVLALDFTLQAGSAGSFTTFFSPATEPCSPTGNGIFQWKGTPEATIAHMVQLLGEFDTQSRGLVAPTFPHALYQATQTGPRSLRLRMNLDAQRAYNALTLSLSEADFEAFIQALHDGQIGFCQYDSFNQLIEPSTFDYTLEVSQLGIASPCAEEPEYAPPIWPGDALAFFSPSLPNLIAKRYALGFFAMDDPQFNVQSIDGYADVFQASQGLYIEAHIPNHVEKGCYRIAILEDRGSNELPASKAASGAWTDTNGMATETNQTGYVQLLTSIENAGALGGFSGHYRVECASANGVGQDVRITTNSITLQPSSWYRWELRVKVPAASIPLLAPTLVLEPSVFGATAFANATSWQYDASLADIWVYLSIDFATDVTGIVALDLVTSAPIVCNADHPVFEFYTSDWRVSQPVTPQIIASSQPLSVSQLRCYQPQLLIEADDFCAPFTYQLANARRQLVRLPLQLSRPQTTTERTLYTRADGSTVKLSARLARYHTLETGYLDAQRHEFLAAVLENDSVKLLLPSGELSLVQEDAYEVQWSNEIPRPVLAKAVAKMRQSAYVSQVYACS
jgi:hypothetical protein